MELRIKQKAKERGVSISDLSGKLGITRQSLHGVLKGKITIDRLVDISNILGCSIYELMEPEKGFGYVYDDANKFVGVLRDINKDIDLRGRAVREKLDQMRRGNIGIAWTGMRLTHEEYKEGLDILQNHPDREKAIEVLNIFRHRRPVK